MGGMTYENLLGGPAPTYLPDDEEASSALRTAADPASVGRTSWNAISPRRRVESEVTSPGEPPRAMNGAVWARPSAEIGRAHV